MDWIKEIILIGTFGYIHFFTFITHLHLQYIYNTFMKYNPVKFTKYQSKSLIILYSIIYYWFYLSVCFGYFLSKIFFNFFDEINKTDFSKAIQFRKKFSFKIIIKIIITMIQSFFFN